MAPPPAPRVQQLTVVKSTVTAGVADVTGQGCDSGAPVFIAVNDTPVAQTVADAKGNFATDFSTGTTPAGRNDVQAKCGPTMNALLDIVLVSEVGTLAPSMVVVLLFLVAFGWIVLRSSRAAAAGGGSEQ